MKRCLKLLFVSVLIAGLASSSLFVMDSMSGVISANTEDETVSNEGTSDKTAAEGASDSANSNDGTVSGDSAGTVLSPVVYHLDGLEATGNLEIDVKFVLPISNITNPNIVLTLKDDKGNSEKIDFNGITEMKRSDYTLGDQAGEMSIRKMDKEGGVINGVDGEAVKYYAVTVYNLKKGKYRNPES